MLGNAGKKLQTMVDLAEDLYEKVNQLRDQINALRETLDETSERVAAVEAEQAEQRALLDAIAEEHGLDVDNVVDDAEVASDGAESEGATEADTATEAEKTAADAPSTED